MRQLRAKWTPLPGNDQAVLIEGSDVVEINCRLVPPWAEGRVLAMFGHWLADRIELAPTVSVLPGLALVPDDIPTLIERALTPLVDPTADLVVERPPPGLEELGIEEQQAYAVWDVG